MAQLKSYRDIMSDETKKAQDELNKYETNPYGDYAQSQQVTDAYNNWQNIQNNKPGEYQSQYSGEISKLLDKIVNGKGFSYDFNADPIYQQYKDQYTALGNQAMMDTTANASTLTGGYGNSYATTAGSQAYQNYLQQLNNVIPELYQTALEKYNADRENTYNQFNALGTQEDRAYGQYQDKYQNWQNDTANAMSAYSMMHDQDFADYQQKVSNWQNDRNYHTDKYNNSLAGDQWTASYNQTDAENERAYQEWLAEQEYQKQRDAVADEQWAKQFALSQAQAASAGSSSGGRTGRSSSGSSNRTSDKNSGADMNEMFKSAYKLIHAGEGAYSGMLASNVNKGVITREEAEKIIRQIKAGYTSYQG